MAAKSNKKKAKEKVAVKQEPIAPTVEVGSHLPGGVSSRSSEPKDTTKKLPRVILKLGPEPLKDTQ